MLINLLSKLLGRLHSGTKAFGAFRNDAFGVFAGGGGSELDRCVFHDAGSLAQSCLHCQEKDLKMLRVLTEGVDCRGMPAALDVNWEAIKMLALSIGVREAARRMNLPEGAVMMRSSREGWMRDIPRSKILPSTMLRPVSGVSDPAKVYLEELKKIDVETRIEHARTQHANAKYIASRKPQINVEDAQNVKACVQTAGILLGWESDRPVARLNLTITGGNSVQELPLNHTLDAEWSESGPSLNVEDY